MRGESTLNIEYSADEKKKKKKKKKKKTCRGVAGSKTMCNQRTSARVNRCMYET
jgi:hypothetical protein